MEVMKMETTKTPEEFVTVVSVGNAVDGDPSSNFVTVLSIGNEKGMEKNFARNSDEEESRVDPNGVDVYPEEEVDVFRLPGERLGFGLKFDGGNKTTEKVRKLFVQSCASESPASRAVCSWGTLGEGDEVISIDGVPVTQMTRLDCVRRLKESQLVIKLLVRYRGALRPEVVSAERKHSQEKRKTPPELPAAPPPVPPRKLRQPRGPADGDANPSPVRKAWTTTNSVPTSPEDSPRGQNSTSSKSTSYESCNSSPQSKTSSKTSSPKVSSETHSPESNRGKLEVPEAAVYLDARSQHDNCSTQGSTSDDTGSSMSTVIDRFSTSDRFSTTSTTSTTSEQHYYPDRAPPIANKLDVLRPNETNATVLTSGADAQLDLVRLLAPFDQLEREFGSNPPSTDYLLARLANSEAVTFVESLGADGDGIVERVTAVVAPNTVLIEETITLQPPLSFQDAPLSYGHETRPGLVYEDLAADSTTHFRPIKDDALVVDRVNGNGIVDPPVVHPSKTTNEASIPPPIPTSGPATREGPPLPARNHVNRININQDAKDSSIEREVQQPPDAPALPPKPMPRREVKARRKRPPPPPPPRREVPPLPTERETDATRVSTTELQVQGDQRVPSLVEPKDEEGTKPKEVSVVIHPVAIVRKEITSAGSVAGSKVEPAIESDREAESSKIEDDESEMGTNKMLEIIEMRKLRALTNRSSPVNPISAKEEVKIGKESAPFKEISKNDCLVETDDVPRAKETNETDSKSTDREETYRSLSSIEAVTDPAKSDTRPTKEENLDDDDSTDDSDGDGYYWQSNLATIGEEEETNSLEFTSANRLASQNEDTKQDDRQMLVNEESSSHDRDEVDCLRRGESHEEEESKIDQQASPKSAVNGRMENCGGGQRLPPDGDEFPMTYQEFNSAQQYQFVASSRVTSRLTTDSNPKLSSTLSANLTSNGSLVSSESQVFATSETFELRSTDKILDSDRSCPRSPPSTIAAPSSPISVGSIREEKTIFLPDNRVVSIRSCVVARSPLDPVKVEDDDEKKVVEASAPEPVPISIPSESYASANGIGTLEKNIISEKRIDINYPSGESSPVKVVVAKAFVEDSPPPPLPTSRPPKTPEKPVARNRPDPPAKAVPAPRPPTTQRKFSLNGELWRQDDKSDKSVRDKIAMFSSRSNEEVPLFPSLVSSPAPVVSVSTGRRRLSKYKSSEDFFAEDERKHRVQDKVNLPERTMSSFDLSAPPRNGDGYETFLQPPTLPLVSPPESPKAKVSFDYPGVSSVTPRPAKSVLRDNEESSRPTLRHSSSFSFDSSVSVTPITSKLRGPSGSSSILTKSTPPLDSPRRSTFYESLNATPSLTSANGCNGSTANEPSSGTLNRATSFSGGLSSLHSRSQSLIELPPSPQISRTNSLASNFRRPSDDARRTSLNQLIEQRRKGISKLRGLVIPEKEPLPISQPIVDLPEIKSRDSIVLQQLPRANIQDKWGSQSSISSTISSASVPSRMTCFKMPATPNLPKYSPAFKRKSLAVYGSSTSASTRDSSATAGPLSDAPKSLESICSPTRSDCSFFEYASNSSSRSKPTPRKSRPEYDDSDNDSAVSSSRSSISRGFSPPLSPAPSERSTVSSERSYLSAETTYARSSGLESPSRSFLVNESRAVAQERARFSPRTSYQNSEMSSSSSSPDSRSPLPEVYARNDHRTLNRSSSTDTNCSTASSTLTSGSQASAESLSRRVLKPRSVEAINRKNILASARCRSGRDLNGSPLIQRKFKDEEETQVESNLARENESYPRSTETGSAGHESPQRSNSNVKIAYVESIGESETGSQPPLETPPEVPGNIITSIRAEIRPVGPEVVPVSEESNEWSHRTEVRSSSSTSTVTSRRSSATTLASETTSGCTVEATKMEIGEIRSTREFKPSSAREEEKGKKSTGSAFVENSKTRTSSGFVRDKNPASSNDPMTVLTTTKTRSRSAVHSEERTFVRSQSNMSLEEILDRTNSPDTGTGSAQSSFSSSSKSWSTKEEKMFVSKIPTPEKVKVVSESVQLTETVKSAVPTSRIPMPRTLGRRSVSVTDMKKALEKSEPLSSVITNQGPRRSVSGTVSHNRFPSLDSSVDDVNRRRVASNDVETTSEQFGSISSLASTTSLISQQELAQLVEEATLEEQRGLHEVVVVLLHKENPSGSVGITLAGGADCETKEITVHRVLSHSIADKDGRVQRGDRILSINGRSTKGLTHRESLTVLKQPRSEVVLVVSRARDETGTRLRSRTESVETIVEGSELNGTTSEQTAWGPPASLCILKEGAGLGFSLEGGRDSPLGDRPLVVKKIFAGGAAEKTGALRAGDQMLEVSGCDVTRMSRIEAWSFMKKLQDGEVNLLVRHPATK